MLIFKKTSGNIKMAAGMLTELEGSVGDSCLSYKELYHASVERSWNLQEQLKKYSGLLSKHQRITELKVMWWLIIICIT